MANDKNNRGRLYAKISTEYPQEYVMDQNRNKLLDHRALWMFKEWKREGGP